VPLQNIIQMPENLTQTPIINPQRLSQLKLLKWCFIGIIFIDTMILLFFNGANISLKYTMKMDPLPPNVTAQELKEASEFFTVAYWPVHIFGLLHILLCIFSFIRFHQKKWHPVIIVTAIFSLCILPLGPFFGLVLLVFLFYSKGKELFQN
jgi:hypothetical protein